MCTQWRVGMSVVGLDYTAVFAVAEVCGMKMTPELLEGLQILEFDYLQERAEEWQTNE